MGRTGEGATKSSTPPAYGGAEPEFVVRRFLRDSRRKQVPEVSEGSKMGGEIF